MARRFEAGGTLWCVSPEWPDHARHVAVEFVHPVIVGKRALPAVAVTAADPAGPVRDRSDRHDILLVVASGPEPGLVDLLRRARVWGLATVWLGAAGGPPPPGLVDHTLLCDDPEGLYGRQAVLAYHVLWELTHVCLEHPGLVSTPAGETTVCVTCSDEARRGEVLFAGGGRAFVRSEQGREEVDVSLVPPVSAGDTVLVHAGVAISYIPGHRDGD